MDFLAQARQDGTVAAGGKAGGGKGGKERGEGKYSSGLREIVQAMIPVVVNRERSINELRDRCSYLVVIYDEQVKKDTVEIRTAR